MIDFCKNCELVHNLLDDCRRSNKTLLENLKKLKQKEPYMKYTAKLLMLCSGAAKSMREVREYIKAGLIEINGIKIEDPEQEIENKTGDVLKRGKEEFMIP